MGARDLRAFCRPPMGVPVAFAGVSTYPDGSLVCGLFDRPIAEQLGYQGTSGVMSAAPELRLPSGTFQPMPDDGDVITVTDDGAVTRYTVGSPGAEDDGAFLVYTLYLAGTSIDASAATGQSVASDVLDAVVATLGGNAQNAWRCRFRHFSPAELPADNVLPDSGVASYEDTDDVERPFRFLVRHLAAATDGADKLADARYVRGARLLTADPTLRSLVRYLREIDTKWEVEGRESEIAALVATYEVQFSTSRHDPSIAGT